MTGQLIARDEAADHQTIRGYGGGGGGIVGNTQ